MMGEDTVSLLYYLLFSHAPLLFCVINICVTASSTININYVFICIQLLELWVSLINGFRIEFLNSAGRDSDVYVATSN